MTEQSTYQPNYSPLNITWYPEGWGNNCTSHIPFKNILSINIHIPVSALSELEERPSYSYNELRGVFTMTDKQETSHAFVRSRSNDELDAARYRRLAWLVEFGEWSVCKHVIKDSYGLTDDTFMDDKADMDVWLDKPEVIADADACAKALQVAND